MSVYRFKVTFAEYDDVSRDIEIQSVQTFGHFSEAIFASIGFDGKLGAQFYLSGDTWKQGNPVASDLAKAKLCNSISDPHQRFLFTSGTWEFFVELMRIVKDEKGVVYPRCAKKTGDAPKQYLQVNGKVPIPVPEDDGLLQEEYVDDSGSAGDDEEEGGTPVVAEEENHAPGEEEGADDVDFTFDSSGEEVEEQDNES